VWSLYEQIYIGALECGDIGLVDECSKRLNKKFPDSVRVKRLLGMQYEYNKEYKKAQELYDSLLASNPSNLLILKRKVCCTNISCCIQSTMFTSFACV
jgi:ER membrane protein complex subunit 2